MGFVKPARVTKADFLTSLTSPGESKFYVTGDPDQIPRSSGKFADAWNRSQQAQDVRDEILRFHSQLLDNQRTPVDAKAHGLV